MPLPNKTRNDAIMTNHMCLLLRLNSNLYDTYNMIENLAYVIMGFAATYLSLEVAWHFTACRLKEDISDEKKIMKSCMFKEMKMVLMTSPQAGLGRVR
jgi:hypothetical protein